MKEKEAGRQKKEKKTHIELEGESGKGKGGNGGQGFGVGFDQNALYTCTELSTNNNNIYSEANSMSGLGIRRLICHSSHSPLYISIMESGSDVITHPYSLWFS